MVKTSVVHVIKFFLKYLSIFFSKNIKYFFLIIIEIGISGFHYLTFLGGVSIYYCEVGKTNNYDEASYMYDTIKKGINFFECEYRRYEIALVN